jgi:hypothetical protein
MTSANGAFVLAGVVWLVPSVSRRRRKAPRRASEQAGPRQPTRGADHHAGGTGLSRLPAGPQPPGLGDEASRGLRLHPDRVPIKPTVDPLFFEQQRWAAPLQPDGFGTLIHNYAGQSPNVSPPDTTGDVGPTYFVQSANQAVSTVRVIDKATGANAKTFTIQSLATSSPCNSGFCDAVVNYDRAADRWMISEIPSSGGSVCVYVSKSADPTGPWYAYTFAVETSLTDYPKYGVWPQNGNGGSYLIGVNAGSAGRDIFALDRAKMLAGLPASGLSSTTDRRRR